VKKRNNYTILIQGKIDRGMMNLWFDIIDVNELKPYIITRNFGGNQGRVWYKDNFDHSENDCLTSINKN